MICINFYLFFVVGLSYNMHWGKEIFEFTVEKNVCIKVSFCYPEKKLLYVQKNFLEQNFEIFMGHTLKGSLSETPQIITFWPFWEDLWVPRVLETLDFFYCSFFDNCHRKSAFISFDTIFQSQIFHVKFKPKWTIFWKIPKNVYYEKK